MPGAPRVGKTAAIILGASEWPKSTFKPAESFSRSAADFQAYLQDPAGCALSAENVLSLFDSEAHPGQQMSAIRDFLEKHDADGSPLTDLILYYVGHGGFTEAGADYFLALRTTTKDMEGVSSLRIADLARVLKRWSRRARRYLILDCCFAGEASRVFLSGTLQVATRKVTSELPESGTALLCASSSQDPALALPGEEHTMFSGALLEVLRKGVASDLERLSMEDIGHEIESYLRKRYRDAAVQPEVHCPDQKRGIVAKVALFPNPGYRPPAIEPDPVPPPDPRPPKPRWWHIAAILVGASAAGVGIVFLLLRPTPTSPRPPLATVKFGYVDKRGVSIDSVAQHVAVANDGTSAALDSKHVHLLRPDGTRSVFATQPSTNAYISLDISDGGNLVAAGGDDGSYLIWDTLTGKVKVRGKLPEGHTFWIRFTGPDSIVAASRFYFVRDSVRPDPDNPAHPVHVPGERESRVGDIGTSAQIMALLGSEDTVSIREFSGRKVAVLQGQRLDWSAVVFSPDENTLWLGDKSGSMRRWDWRRGAAATEPCRIPGGGKIIGFWTLINGHVAARENQGLISCQPLELPGVPAGKFVTAAVSPNQKYFVVSDSSGNIEILTYEKLE